MNIVLTEAETAELAAGGSITITGTAPVVTPVPTPVPTPKPPAPTPPTPTPPTPSGAALWVYHKGVYTWAGDWSGINGINYSYTASKGVDGVSPCIMIPSASQWEFWLPYPHVTAGSPASNGIGYNIAGMTHFTIAIKPTMAGLGCTMGFYEANAQTVDIAFGNSVTINTAKYGPAVMVANAWNVYTIPLADFGIGTPGWIYKFIVQQQGTTPQEWFIDQVGFS